MNARTATLGLLALVLLPAASALDAFPEPSSLGPTRATFIVRAGPVLAITADGPLDVLVGDAWAPAPLTLQRPASGWRGIPDAAEVHVQRSDATRALHVELWDGATGIVLEWPPARNVPLGGVGPAAAAILAAWAHVHRGRTGETTRI